MFIRSSVFSVITLVYLSFPLGTFEPITEVFPSFGNVEESLVTNSTTKVVGIFGSCIFDYQAEWEAFGHDVFGNIDQIDFLDPPTLDTITLEFKWRITTTTGVVLTNWFTFNDTVSHPNPTTSFFQFWDGYDKFGNRMPNGAYVVNMSARITDSSPYISGCINDTYTEGFSISVF